MAGFEQRQSPKWLVMVPAGIFAPQPRLRACLGPLAPVPPLADPPEETIYTARGPAAKRPVGYLLDRYIY